MAWAPRQPPEDSAPSRRRLASGGLGQGAGGKYHPVVVPPPAPRPVARAERPSRRHASLEGRSLLRIRRGGSGVTQRAASSERSRAILILWYHQPLSRCRRPDAFTETRLGQGGRGSVSLSEADGLVQSRFLAYRGGVENSIFLSRQYSRGRGGHRFARSLSMPAVRRKGSGRSSLSRYRPSSVVSGARKVGSHLSHACTNILLVTFDTKTTCSTYIITCETFRESQKPRELSRPPQSG